MNMENMDNQNNKNNEVEDISESSGAETNEGFTPDEFPGETVEPVENDDINVQKVNELTEEVTRLNDVILRERAEFVNYRKRTNQENLQQEGRIAGKILQEMVPVFDAFDLLLTSVHTGEQAIDKFLEGSRLIRKQLWQVFESLGVEEIDPDKQEFDPQTMEALSVSESENAEKETVSQVYQKGYQYKGRTLRPARVAVEKPKQA